MNISEYRSLVKHNWKEIWAERNFKWQFFLCLLCMIGFAFFFPWFFDFIEARQGNVIVDYVLKFLPSHDVSWVIFFFLYSGMLISLVYLVAYPRQLLLALQTYCMVTVLRMISITLVPLHPPMGYMPLREPVAQFFTNDGRIISKDLFFSGHMATIMSLYYPVRNKIMRQVVMYLTIIVGILLLVQHVHYTIDVLMAPFATYACFLFSKRITADIKSRSSDHHPL